MILKEVAETLILAMAGSFLVAVLFVPFFLKTLLRPVCPERNIHKVDTVMGVLRRTLQVYGLQSDPIRYVCTCNLGRKIWPNLPCYKLSYLVQYLDLADYHQHYALDDALMCGRVMYRECGSHLLDEEGFHRYLSEKHYTPKVLPAYANNCTFLPSQG